MKFAANWNGMAELPATADGFVAPSGEFDCRIEVDKDPPQPWLELQLMTRDAPIMVSAPQL